MKELSLNIPLLATESAGNNAALDICPELLPNIYFSTPVQIDAYTAFAARYKARFGHEPQFISAVTAYDAMMVVAEGLKKTNGEGGVALRDAIAATKIPGVSLPTISFNQKGFVTTPEDAFHMQTVKDGKYVTIGRYATPIGK
jgi:ABC-type branched-subunit amino acid transport system substrate-binding protein